MKTKLTILKLLLILCSTFVTTAAFGQIIYWIGPNGADFGYGTNWTGDDGSGGTVPNTGTLCTFDGAVPGNLTLYTSNGINGTGIPMGPGFGPNGFSIDLAPSQTGSVRLTCNTNIGTALIFGFNAFRVQAGAGSLILGDGSSHQAPAVLRPSGSAHTWINNSTNSVIINPNFQIQNGGGSVGQVMNFQGTGDFAITNALRFNNNAPAGDLQWDSSGTTVWAEGGVNNIFNSPLGNVVINAGKVIVEGSDLLPATPYTTTVSNGTLIVNGTNAASSIIVSGGTLGGTGILGTVTIQSGGTLAPGASVGTLTINSDLTIAGNLAIEVNKSLAQSNDLVVVSGALTNTGTGTLTVSNLGPALAVGDRFTLFSKPVQNGAALNVVGSGALWANNLAVDGSITVSAAGPSITFVGLDSANNRNIGLTNNWSDGVNPAAPTNGIIGTFNGTVPGNLTVYSLDGIEHNNGATGPYPGPIGGAFGSSGFSIHLTPSQTGSVTITSTNTSGSSAGMGFNGIQVDNGAGQLILGGGATQVVAVLRPVRGNHVWKNNSENPVVINPNFQIRNGGGDFGHVINFQGTGDFAITNSLRFFGFADPWPELTWNSTGTTIWASDGGTIISPLGNVIINAGTVIVQSPGLLPSSATNTTTVNNGTLIVNGSNTNRPIIVNGGTLGGTGAVGAVTIQSGGTLAPGSSIGTFTISSNLNIAGNMVFEVNKSLVQSNDFVVVSGGLTNTGTGTLTVSNLGPALVAGDKFTLFSQAMANGAALTVSEPAGVTWTNNLADDGSISVLSFVPAPTLNWTNTGSSLQFSWTGNFKLQSQTNNIDVGISNNWVDYPGGGISGVTAPIDATKATVFFRLAPKP